MKKIVLISLLVLALVAFLMRETIQDSFFGSNLPDPVAIDFEKQMPLSTNNWKLISQNGFSKSYVEYSKHNVIINYWSSKSEESVEELKVWKKLYDDYKNELTFLFITPDSQVEVNSFMEENGYVFPVYYSGSTPPYKSIVFDAVPKTYLITKTGRIVVNYKGAANWNSKKFREILDEVLKHNK